MVRSEWNRYDIDVDGNFDAHDFTRVWSFQTGGTLRSAISYAAGILYFGCDDGNVYALDAQTGEQKWVCPVGGPVVSSPYIGDGVLYIGCDDGKLYAIE